MSGPPPFISDPISEAANAIMDGVAAASPLIDHVLDPFDVLPNAIRIPGTDLYVSLGSFLLGPLIGLPFIPFRRREGGGNDLPTIAPENSYYADLKIFINDVNQDKIAFVTPNGLTSSSEVTKYFKENASFNYREICVPFPNSTINLVFNDTNFDDNDGSINVSICYLGENSDCGCSSNNEDEINGLAVGFTRIDPNLSYPVACHGMVYVGDKDSGLSTGGRCEKDSLISAETKLNEKYYNKYSVSFDDTETESDLEKARVLDLVYKYTGSAWIRQQNLIESVYYHSGVGNVDHSVFFGGIHDTIAKYSFSYDDNLSSLPIPKFDDFNFDSKQIYDIVEDKLYGQVYPQTLTSSQCWENPAWKYNSNFSSPPERVDNPIYIPSPSAEYVGFIRDADFPLVKFLSIEPNNSYQFGLPQTMLQTVGVCNWKPGGWGHWGDAICAVMNTSTEITTTVSEVISGNYVTFTYPFTDTLQVSGDFSAAKQNSFIVKIGTKTLSGTQVLFNGAIDIVNIKLDYNHKLFIYPNDVTNGSLTNINGGISLKSINSNEENINLVGAFQHSFDYTSTNGGTSGYVNRGLWTLTFNSLTDIHDGVLNRTPVDAIQNFTVLDSSMFPISATYVVGTGKVLFDITDRNGIMIGVENKNYSWHDSLENSNFNIAENLNINATIGNDTQERWGTPLWSSAFSNATTYRGDYTFNSRTERANENEGDILHEITDLIFDSSSLMALQNNRIYVTGSTLAQDHNYKSLNNIKIKAKWGVDSISYEPNSLGALYSQTTTLSSNGTCVFTYAPSTALNTITGSIISQGAACCSGIFAFPSHLFVTHMDSTPISSAYSNDWFFNVKYDYVDECAWAIYSNYYTPKDNLQIYDINYTTNCEYSCPETTIQLVVSGTVTSSAGKQFIFSPENFVLTTASSASILSGGVIYVRDYQHDLLDDTMWKVHSVDYEEYIPLIGCVLTQSIPIADFTGGKYHYAQSPVSAISASVSGVVTAVGSYCCAGDNIFPQNFTPINTTTMISGTDMYAIVDYKLYNGCTADAQAFVRVTLQAEHIGTMYTKLQACPVGEVSVLIKTCETICEKTLTSDNTAVIDIGSAGTAYSEYSTNFIQEYRDDSRYKVPEYVVTSNANGYITPNKGIMVSSKWKRYMDGVGLGGDAPDYDTIYNTKAKQAYDIATWKEIGKWNIGQMAFGTPDKAVVVGGHKVSRNVGQSLIGSGMHSCDTSKRVYIWDVSSIPEEDSYLKNYYGRRFNTYYSTSTLPITSNQNRSDLSVIIYDAESDIVVERFGNITFDGSTNSIDVKLDSPMPDEVDVNYSISLTCGDNVKVWWENKTKKGFTVKSEINTWAGSVDYTATSIIKTTEKDIVNISPEKGYIFEK